MNKTYQPLKRQHNVFNQATRKNYFEKLNQALKNLSIVDNYNAKRIQTVKHKFELFEDAAS